MAQIFDLGNSSAALLFENIKHFNMQTQTYKPEIYAYST